MYFNTLDNRANVLAAGQAHLNILMNSPIHISHAFIQGKLKKMKTKLLLSEIKSKSADTNL